MEKFTKAKETLSAEVQPDTPIAQNEQPETPVVGTQPTSNELLSPKAPLWCRLAVMGLLSIGAAYGLEACAHTAPAVTKISENEEKTIKARSKGQALVKLLRLVHLSTGTKTERIETDYALYIEEDENRKGHFKVKFAKKTAADYTESAQIDGAPDSLPEDVNIEDLVKKLPDEVRGDEVTGIKRKQLAKSTAENRARSALIVKLTELFKEDKIEMASGVLKGIPVKVEKLGKKKWQGVIYLNEDLKRQLITSMFGK